MEEAGVRVGNVYDKYGSRNPIVRRLMSGYERSLVRLVGSASPRTIHEVGCGEGYWTLRWQRQGIDARGTDFSKEIIALARTNAEEQRLRSDRFEVRSIYDLEAGRDGADLVVCCEVLEHLEDPIAALEALQRVATDFLIISVPREPIWRMMNMARAKYLPQLGNTPGHIQHWSRRSICQLVSRHFRIIKVLAPVPWTMLLCRPRPAAA